MRARKDFKIPELYAEKSVLRLEEEKVKYFSTKNDLCVQGILEGNIYRFLWQNLVDFPFDYQKLKKFRQVSTVWSIDY